MFLRIVVVNCSELLRENSLWEGLGESLRRTTT